MLYYTYSLPYIVVLLASVRTTTSGLGPWLVMRRKRLRALRHSPPRWHAVIADVKHTRFGRRPAPSISLGTTRGEEERCEEWCGEMFVCAYLMRHISV
jgi:hypothetical protein